MRVADKRLAAQSMSSLRAKVEFSNVDSLHKHEVLKVLKAHRSLINNDDEIRSRQIKNVKCFRNIAENVNERNGGRRMRLISAGRNLISIHLFITLPRSVKLSIESRTESFFVFCLHALFRSMKFN